MNAGDVVIFGIGTAGELANHYFTHDSPYTVRGFVVDEGFERPESFAGRPVMTRPEALSTLDRDRTHVFVAVGYVQLNRARASIAAAFVDAGFTLASYISTHALVAPGVAVGPNAFILENAVLQPFTRLGRHVFVWSGAVVAHHTEVGDDVYIGPQAGIAGHCHIGARSFVGLGAMVRDHVTIGEDCVVGAGVTILSDTPPGQVIKGPAAQVLEIASTDLEKI